ncbi:hypothetical protein TNCT6_35030 [Streptomyces sp. 6-11-2]|nr:hypothetical protein TNCT6_35030 [Streptomyces sp. 6-11-2]
MTAVASQQAASRSARGLSYVSQRDEPDADRALALSGPFQPNAAWLALAALAHNLTRAAGTLARIRVVRTGWGCSPLRSWR